jgi:hypothetical protein
MSKDAVLTKLIVGEAFTIELGDPVGQQYDDIRIGPLRWSGGDWITGDSLPVDTPATSPKVQVKQTPRPSAKPARKRPMNRRRVALIAASVAGIAFIGGVSWYAQRAMNVPTAEANNKAVAHVATATIASTPAVPAASAPSLPTIPTAAIGAASASFPPALPVPMAGPDVRVFDQAYQTPAASPTTEAKLPIAPKEVVAAAAEAKLPKATAAHRASEPDLKAPAVVLDDSSLRQPAVPAANKQTSAQLAPLQSPPVRGSGLVAITPDGKAAVFTNPKSRLPEQFKVGDRLPSGETVRSIDAKQGRVTTSAKEYGLE